MPLVLDADITDLKGADYNPRKIDDATIQKLQGSIRDVGMVKPLIARGKTLVAGHQRTRALLSMGVTTAPVFFLSAETSLYDEVRFNQLHNGTDLDAGDENARVTMDITGQRGFIRVPAKHIDGNLHASQAVVRNEIMGLIAKFGPWGAVVASDAGEVIHCGQYALACKAMGLEMLAYVVPAAEAEKYRSLLGATYGVFSYDKIKRSTFIQTFAQMYRLRGGQRDNNSPTYERFMIPWLKANPGARALDFGCGQGDYVKRLSAQGHDIIGLEFFRRKAGKQQIDVPAINRMVDAVKRSLSKHGPFDVVICDYVMNSVDSQQAEIDVLNTVSAMCKDGGQLFFSGRQRERIDQNLKRKQVTGSKNAAMRYVEFLDEDGMTALYRNGEWFFQKFHSKQDVANLCKRHGFADPVYSTSNSTGWQCKARNTRTTPANVLKSSVKREFDMALNRDGARLARTDILEAMPWLN